MLLWCHTFLSLHLIHTHTQHTYTIHTLVAPWLWESFSLTTKWEDAHANPSDTELCHQDELCFLYLKAIRFPLAVFLTAYWLFGCDGKRANFKIILRKSQSNCQQWRHSIRRKAKGWMIEGKRKREPPSLFRLPKFAILIGHIYSSSRNFSYRNLLW